MIEVVEVGPRDGLQNLNTVLTLDQRIQLIESLAGIGFCHIEGGSFVRPDLLPQMAQSGQVSEYFSPALTKAEQNFWFLVPNQKGLEIALASGCRAIAFFTATSELFNQKNIRMSVPDSLNRIRAMIETLKEREFEFLKFSDPFGAGQPKQLKLRLYISTVISCPYEGYQDPRRTAGIIEWMQQQNIYQTLAQISLGDTIGIGTPKLWRLVLAGLEKDNIAMHCHNTYGTAIASVYEGLCQGVTVFDSSIGGLGGCPYAKGATGNLATEDLLFFLGQEGVPTGIDLYDLRGVFALLSKLKLKNSSHIFEATKFK